MDILRAHIVEALGRRQSSQYKHVADITARKGSGSHGSIIFARRPFTMELDTGWQAITIAI